MSDRYQKESLTAVDLGSLTGLTSAQIDTAYAAAVGRPAANGDSAAGTVVAGTVTLIRRAGKWYVTGALTQIA